MKNLLLVLTLSAAVACPALAQSTNDSGTPPPPPGEGGPGGGHHDHMKFLTDAEKAELKKAHDAALAADPTLGTEEEALKADRPAPGTPPTDAQKEAMHTFRDKMDAAMIKADPAVEPIIEKIKAHHHGPGGPGGDKDGPPPAPPAQ